MKEVTPSWLDSLIKDLGISHLYICNGDEELISSCNSEFNLDYDDFIVTDGMTNVVFHVCNSSNGTIVTGQFVSSTTCVRGASFVLIGSTSSKEGWDLWVDRPFLEDEKFKDKLVETFKRVYNEYSSMKYYVEEWMPKGGLIKNETNVMDLINL